MTDELDHLKSALRATPAPDASTKAAHLELAQKSFAALQENTSDTRQTNKRRTSGAGLIEGVGKMLNMLTARTALATTSGLVAVGLAVVVVLPQMDGPEPMRFGTPVSVTEPPIIVEELSSPLLENTAPAPEITADMRLASPPAAKAERQGISVTGAPELGIIAGANAPTTFHTDMDVQFADAPPNTESFANEPASPLKVVADYPVSTFSIDVDTASYAVVRQSLMAGHLPPAQAVRIEEMVNYFPYTYPAPDGEAPFQPTVTVTGTPWNADTQLVHIALQGALPEIDTRPPLNLVFLIDTSGSMNQPNKLPLLKQSFRLMLAELRPADQVSIVTYAGSAGQVLAPTRAEDRATIMAALDNLAAGGSTAGQAGLQQAYAVAEDMADEGDVTRVILATDGDFNVGIHDPEALKTFIADKRDTGTYLSVLGFGRGNLDDATMQALAQNGNGQAAYIDTLGEARKVLVDQLTGALFPIANDVKVQVEFNPATVAEYRLIGYETRALRREDFNNDKVDAGEIGAGHAVTAIYEVTPAGSPAALNDPLRYRAQEAESGPADELGFLRLRYKAPGDDTSQLIETPIPLQTAAKSEAQFATAIAGFGQLLRGSVYTGDWSYSDAIALANAAKGDDPFGYRAEAITLMRLADSLSR
ncbi:von Willebrand factor A [Actibacterium mucosum KCTC 23349]|uniref:von Willebrand factor A n=1 Tax=Actibacterium mucosum KCTC 23349 TaxID=1454373 RepID=A0A037ZH61_9RHOB|nr:VWA domain-containing protein [Actibacterium mucosum]KAJ54934.1 von Willebrand factor A [Actibacterium mucosum KCTC 23349]